MTEKKAKRDKKFSIEELYQNKNFVPPKEKNLETIFEEPRKSKDGRPILTSVRKYRRYLHFDPTENKIQKRKLKAKKCINRLKSNKLRTRSSSSKIVTCDDISMYILESMGDSSDSDMDTTHKVDKQSSDKSEKISTLKEAPETITSGDYETESAQNVTETCDLDSAAHSQETYLASEAEHSQETSNSSKPASSHQVPESQQSTKAKNLPEEAKDDSSSDTSEEPVERSSFRSSCIVT
ncbi:tantalus domain-containing protein [Trichonephila inaurata madagascariensis]|uniref:Tantalus domain-containing protein n=1 Tax=Trichonephila inaurata madagascariensis TaxID=2747483 RepID=A0A8X7BT31_9ARAC|nr:tantalus domain-containing protein [Trichonephila inaurata madagascariensis]